MSITSFQYKQLIRSKMLMWIILKSCDVIFRRCFVYLQQVIIFKSICKIYGFLLRHVWPRNRTSYINLPRTYIHKPLLYFANVYIWTIIHMHLSNWNSVSGKIPRPHTNILRYLQKFAFSSCGDIYFDIHLKCWE